MNCQFFLVTVGSHFISMCMFVEVKREICYQFIFLARSEEKVSISGSICCYLKIEL